jgi:hypothetical protein
MMNDDMLMTIYADQSFYPILLTDAEGGIFHAATVTSAASHSKGSSRAVSRLVHRLVNRPRNMIAGRIRSNLRKKFP